MRPITRHALAVLGASVLAIGCGGTVAPDGDRSGARDGDEGWVVGKDVSIHEREGVVHDTYMGVSCAQANSTECDRVRIAIWLEEPALQLHAQVAGRSVPIDISESGCRGLDYCAGSLQPAGLLDGPLPPDERGGYEWFGKPSISTDVRIEGRLVDGTAVSEALEDVWLSPGWG